MKAASTRLRILLLIALVAVSLSGVRNFLADEVILNPGTISGSIQVGAETINYASIYASYSSYSSSTSINPNTTPASYSLTVNVPQGTTPTYNLSSTVYLNNWRTYFSFPSQQVVAQEGQTVTADLVVANPGYIQGTITANGGTLSSAYLYGYSSGGYTQTYIYGSEGGTFRMPVIPGTGITLYGYAYFTNGTYADLAYRTFDVGAGETVTSDYSLDVPIPPVVATGTLAGTIQSIGAVTPDYHSLAASGPSYASQFLTANGPYTFSDLKVGGYYMYAYTYFNNYASYFYHPDASFSPTRYPTVNDGATTTVNISTDQAYLSGKIRLTGSLMPSELDYASTNAYSSSSSGASAGGPIQAATGAYSLVLSAGSWSNYYLNAQFSNSDSGSYLRQYLYFYDYQKINNPVTLAAGETVQQNSTYPMGSVSITFRILGNNNLTLSNPSLSGTCTRLAPDNQTIWYYSFNAYGNQSNSPTGSVRFLGMEGTCELDAYAQVGGSNTTFGHLSGVRVIPGVDQTIDIGGPTLTVESPAPGYITSNSTIVVSGKATDDVQVAAVTVNGVSATLSPSGSSDPHEVNFTATISLSKGPNTITTVATDTSANSSSDRRTVYRDEGPPQIAFTPFDGTVTASTVTTVLGTATDDAGIAAITVNGQSVSFSPTGGAQNEVSFSMPLTLVPGDNFIEVAATDVSTQTASQTHKVIVGSNRPPVAIAQSLTVAAQAPMCVAPASVNNGSYDPDNDPITLAQSPAGPYSLGSTAVTLSVNDNHGASASAGATVTVVDASAPSISSVTASPGVLWPPNHQMVDVTLSVAASDFCDASMKCSVKSVTSNQPLNGTGDGNTEADWEIVRGTVTGSGNVLIRLRAERKGNSSQAPRIYTINLECKDASGNASARSVTVTAPHDQSK